MNESVRKQGKLELYEYELRNARSTAKLFKGTPEIEQ